jgi:hypothetical protein
LGRRSLEHLADRTAGHGVALIGRKIGERGQDKATVGHPRVRNFQLGAADHGPAEQQDIDIDSARAFGDGADAAEFAFDPAGAGEQLHGEQSGLAFDYQVEKPSLVGVVDGLSLVGGRDAKDVDAAYGQALDGGAEIGVAVAYV